MSPKTFWVRKNLGTKRILGPTFFLESKYFEICWFKKVFEHFLGPNNFNQKNFGYTKIAIPLIVVPSIFWSKKIFLVWKFVGQIYFFVFQTPCRHLPTPSHSVRHLQDTLQTPTNHLQYTYQILSRQLPDTIQTSSRHLPVPYKTLTRNLPEEWPVPGEVIRDST